VGFILLEYLCECGARIESLEDRSDPARVITHLGCGGAVAERTIPAVKSLTRWGSVSRGASDPPPPNVMDTRPLADGMPISQFREKRRKYHRDRRLAKIRSWVS